MRSLCNKKNKNQFVRLIVLIFLFSAHSSMVYALEAPAYPWAGGDTTISGIISEFFTIALGLAGVAALGVLIYGGILWTVSGAVSTQQDAKEYISGAIWGLVLLLGSYLILDTINPELVSLKGPTVNLVALPVSQTTTESPVWADGGPSKITSQEVRDKIAYINGQGGGTITIKPECTPNQSVNCVKTDGVRETTLNGVIAVKKDCEKWSGLNCDIDITATAEEGHTAGPGSHAEGYKLDVRAYGTVKPMVDEYGNALPGFIYMFKEKNDNSGTEFYLINNLKNKPEGGIRLNQSYEGKDGYIYRLENNRRNGKVIPGYHWDISFYRKPNAQ